MRHEDGAWHARPRCSQRNRLAVVAARGGDDALERPSAALQGVEVDDAAAHLEGADGRVVLVLDPHLRPCPLGQQRPGIERRRRHNRAHQRDGRFQLRFLAAEVTDVEFVATATEQEALLLENTVIKKRQPRYNLKLKDDKAFLLLRLDRREPWPWYRLVRRRQDDGALYFGPFASAKAVRRTLRLLRVSHRSS